MSHFVRLLVGWLICRNFLKRQESYSSIPLTRVLYFHVLQLLISHYIFLYIYLSLTLRYCTYLFTSHSSIISLYIPTSGLRPFVRPLWLSLSAMSSRSTCFFYICIYNLIYLSILIQPYIFISKRSPSITISWSSISGKL